MAEARDRGMGTNPFPTTRTKSKNTDQLSGWADEDWWFAREDGTDPNLR